MQKSSRRKRIRAIVLMQRSVCQWPGCNNRATDMHELVPRSLTEGNEKARELSFSPELVSALCQSCHLKHAHGHAKTARTVLVCENIRIYGKKRVLDAFTRLVEALGRKLPNDFLGDTDEC
jgi:5-methylcytosine-specific restriction endonuclease McrA